MAPVARLRALRSALALTRPPFWIEVASGLTAFLWGAYVHFVVGELADRPGYQALVRVAPDQVWELLGMAGGILQVLGARSDSGARKLFGLAMIGLWVMVADGMHASSPLSPGVVFPTVMALMNLVVVTLSPGTLLFWRR